MHPYQDASRPTEERVSDLLSRMSLPEKVGQMMQLDGRGELDSLIREKQPGSLLHILGDRLNEAIDLAAENRLGIPLLFGEDAIHGHSFWSGATIFPTQLAMACTWDTQLLRSVARATAREVASTGAKWTFSPVLCLTRDLRWGRVDETFGEDPYLIGEMAVAMIEGYQTDDWTQPEAILATAKHYAGYSETQGGRDASEADISRRKLRSFFLPPFERAARSGCMAFMTGYQSMEGRPSTANGWLLREVLKKEWGFEGILVTDWDNVGRMHWEQHVSPNLKEAAATAVKSGNDLIMSTPGFFEAAQEAVAEGLLDEELIDEAVRRILGVKFRLGLFENPGRADHQKQREVVGCQEHRDLNLEVARKSLVLLRNDGGLLPLRAGEEKTLAVIGPNADDDLAQLGDWTLGSGQMEYNGSKHPRECTTTVLDGIKQLAPDGWEVLYSKGCHVEDASLDELDHACELAAQADYVVLVVGDNLGFNGEYKSTATLELQGGQKELVRRVAAAGTPVIGVLVSGKPLVLPDELREAPALFSLFNPGMRGGEAFAEALWGKINPSGKLTVSFPRHVGQQPTFYSQVRGQHGNRYADLTQEPAFVFGEGLSYTTYDYSDLALEKNDVAVGDCLRFTVKVTNTGDLDGDEVVQVYVEDTYTSATWVQMELKRFARVTLAAGESRTVSFSLPVEELSIVNADGERVVEPGAFRLFVGSSSRGKDLLEASFSVTS